MSGSGSGSGVGSGSGSGSGSGEGEGSVTTGEVITVFTVAMAVTISFVLDALERAIRRFKYSSLMLKMMFRETMIVGLVSGILYTLERTDNPIAHDQVGPFASAQTVPLVPGNVCATVCAGCLRHLASQATRVGMTVWRGRG